MAYTDTNAPAPSLQLPPGLTPESLQMILAMAKQQAGSRTGLHVEFYARAKPDKKASMKESRPVYRDVDYCRIRFPGDKNRVIDQPAHEKKLLVRSSGGGIAADPMGGISYRQSYAEAFPQHFALYKQGHAAQVVGTPIAELPFLTEAQRAEMRAVSVHTAEQLAQVPDTFLPKLGMGARALRDQARDYLDRATTTATASELTSQVRAAEDRIAELEQMIASMTAADTADMTKEVASAEIPDFEAWERDDLRVFIENETGSPPDQRLGADRLAEAAAAIYREKLEAISKPA